jgi:hypothetical protein
MAATPALAPLEIEARTTRRVWTRIIPFVFVLFVIYYVDRVNIGFAALTMNKELAITSQQYGFIATASGLSAIGRTTWHLSSREGADCVIVSSACWPRNCPNTPSWREISPINRHSKMDRAKWPERGLGGFLHALENTQNPIDVAGPSEPSPHAPDSCRTKFFLEFWIRGCTPDLAGQVLRIQGAEVESRFTA